MTASSRVNQAYQARNVFGRKKLYMNWGLWEPDTDELDDAALALVLRLGKLAGLGPETHLLDVGFGFGDQLIDWCQHAALGRADGINVCPEQAEFVTKRLSESGLSDRVQVQVGDAVRLSFEDRRFDAVTAVECAFHFNTREAFFREAHRVLKESGRLVLADFIGVSHPSRGQRLAQAVASKAWGFAPGSFCSAAEYEVLLQRAGFRDIAIDTVTDQVIAPGLAYARRRLRDADLRGRMHPAARAGIKGMLGMSKAMGDPLPGEYVLVRAVK